MIKKGLVGINAKVRGVAGPPDITAPSAPVLTTGAITSTSVAISWTAATDNVGVTGYDVYVNSVFNGSTASTTYTVMGLAASTGYSIFVKAKDAAGNNTDSNTITPTTAAPGTLPAIEGYGVNATGGAGQPVYHVTNTSSSGAGSLINGIASNRIIVFDVSGTINARHDIISKSNLTIDGTTAPYPGIVITTNGGDGMSVQGNSNNVIIQGLTFINCSGDGCNVIENSTNVVIRHCTAYGNQDGNIDFAADCSLCTMQYCIIGNHNGAPSGGTGGTLVTGHLVSVHHNLFYPKSPNPDEGERFPFCHRNYGVAGTPDADIRNNLVWQYGRGNATGSGYGSGIGYNAKANIVNNYYKTTDSAAAPDGVDNSIDGTTSQVYSAGNVSGNGLNFNTGSSYTNHAEFTITAPFAITAESACAATAKILLYAGITQRSGGNRTPVEQGYINDITPLTGC